MFELVDNAEKNEIFEEKWKKVCQESEFIYVTVPFHVFQRLGITRYLIKDEDNYIGTIEFVKFTPGGYSIINHYFDFHANFKDDGSTYEVGKLSIDKKRRKEGHLEKILMVLKHVAESKKVTRYLATIEGKLFMTLQRFGFSLNQLDDEIIKETYTAISTKFNVHRLYEDIENCKWLQRKLARRK